MQENKYYQFKIDSFKIRLPLDIVPIDFIKKNFSETLLTVSESSGEILKETELRKFTHSIEDDANISSITFELEKLPIGRTYQTVDVLTFMVTSKHLNRDYYDGINSDTFQIIYKYILDAGLNVPYNKLIEFGEYLDLDVCYDAVLSNYTALRDIVKQKAKLSFRYGGGFHEFTKKDENEGFHFGTRSTASLSKPYLKVYNKTLDSQSIKHKNFFNHYGILTENNVYRTEFTLKNKKHISKSFKLGNRLKDLFEVSQSRWQSILKDIISKHINNDKVALLSPQSESYISTNDVLFEILLLTKNTEITISDIEKMLAVRIKSRNTLNRQIDILNNVNNRILESDEVYKENYEVSKYLDFILKC